MLSHRVGVPAVPFSSSAHVVRKVAPTSASGASSVTTAAVPNGPPPHCPAGCGHATVTVAESAMSMPAAIHLLTSQFSGTAITCARPSPSVAHRPNAITVLASCTTLKARLKSVVPAIDFALSYRVIAASASAVVAHANVLLFSRPCHP